jgi:hypothetical protein
MAETKLVRCNRGAFYNVILDLRKESATFGKSFGDRTSTYARETRKTTAVAGSEKGVSRPQFGIHRCSAVVHSAKLLIAPWDTPRRSFRRKRCQNLLSSKYAAQKKESLTGAVIDAQSRAWRTPVKRELDGLFGELAAFNEPIHCAQAVSQRGCR